MRLLVTGSRTWEDEERLCRVLDELARQIAYRHKERYIREGLTLVSGHARGVDQMAEKWFADRFPLEEPELWHADWSLGKKAGPIRNHAMVDSRPDVCVAFIAACPCPKLSFPHGTHGAVDCADYAEAQGIVTTRYWDRVLV